MFVMERPQEAALRGRCKSMIEAAGLTLRSPNGAGKATIRCPPGYSKAELTSGGPFAVGDALFLRLETARD